MAIDDFMALVLMIYDIDTSDFVARILMFDDGIYIDRCDSGIDRCVSLMLFVWHRY